MSSTQKTEDLLHILGIQSSIVWEDAEANRTAFTKRIEELTKANENIDIIVLPEVFTTGFTMNLSKIDSWASRDTLFKSY